MTACPDSPSRPWGIKGSCFPWFIWSFRLISSSIHEFAEKMYWLSHARTPTFAKPKAEVPSFRISAFEYPLSNLYFQVSNSKFQLPSFNLQVSTFDSQVRRLNTFNCPVAIFNLPSSILDLQPLRSKCLAWTFVYRSNLKIQAKDSSHNFCISGLVFQV